MSERRNPLLERVLQSGELLTCEVKFPHLSEPEVFTFKRPSGADIGRLRRRRQVDALRMVKDLQKDGVALDRLKEIDGLEGDAKFNAMAEIPEMMGHAGERNERFAAECVAASLDTGRDEDGNPYPAITVDDALDLLEACGGVESEFARTAREACGMDDPNPDGEDEAVDPFA